MRSAGRAVRVAAWLLLAGGLGLIAFNPGLPSLQYAVVWLGVLAIARGVSTLAPWLAVAIDLALLVVLFFGLEIGGLLLVPSIVAFTVADAIGPEEAAGAPGRTQRPARRGR